MTDRDRLIELLLKSEILCNTCGESTNTYCAEALADYLLANGVIVPPCKVGDYAKYKYNGAEAIWKITSISFYAEGQPQLSLTHGKVTNTVGLAFFEDRFEIIPKEEAEEKLKEMNNNARDIV